MVYFPGITHEATATYKVYAENPQSGQPFQITSEHKTQVLGTSCKDHKNSFEEKLKLVVSVVTTEIAVFLPLTTEVLTVSTRMVSTVEYECHLILTKYCEMEFRAQRAIIHVNLRSFGASMQI